ncbi:MAG: DeoR/GlpR transcriptional regulator [Clostridia bacterium]|nr:DeoR/GlpR transcriptional regulator [Clostridia bacterium]
MLTDARRKAIEHIAAKDGEVIISKVAKELGVSIETIRRDISQLCKENILTKVHGGAVPVVSVLSEATYRHRKEANFKTKQIIGRTAEKLISSNQVIAFSTGSTIEAIVSNIHKKSIKVLTNSLPICDILSKLAESGEFDGDITLFGGLLNPKEHFTLGTSVTDKISSYHFDTAFIGAVGVCSQGLMCTTSEEGDIAAKLALSSSQVILVVESRKIGKPSVYRFADIGIVNKIVTDNENKISDEMLELFKKNNIEIIIAE